MKRCRGCLTVNAQRRKKCEACGRTLPKTRRPKHLAALDQPIEAFVAANDGWPGCWVCADLKLEGFGGTIVRDHDHRAGVPRGLLCQYHNRKLGPVYTPELLASYLRYTTRRAA